MVRPPPHRGRRASFVVAPTPHVRTSPMPLLLLLALLAAGPSILVQAAPLQCAAQSSQAAFPPTPDGACACVDGWTGPECRVCTVDGVCGSGQACRKGLPMYKELHGSCRVGTKGFADFLGGAGQVMLTMGMPAEGGGKATLETTILAVPTPGTLAPVFTCKASECDMARENTGSKRIGLKCAKSACTPLCDKAKDKFCIDIMLNLLAQIGKKGTFDLVCEADGSACTAHEAVLDAFFKGILYDQCSLGECAPANVGNQTLQESMSFALPPAKPSALYRVNQALAAGGLALMIGAILAGLALYQYSSKAVDSVGEALLGLEEEGKQGDSGGGGVDGGEEEQHRSLPLGEGGGDGGGDAAGDGNSGSSNNNTSTSTGPGAAAAAAAAAADAAEGLALFAWRDVQYSVRSSKAGNHGNHGKGGGRKVILHGVSGEARAGEITALMGPSGSGKSTLLDLLALRDKGPAPSSNPLPRLYNALKTLLPSSSTPTPTAAPRISGALTLTEEDSNSPPLTLDARALCAQSRANDSTAAAVAAAKRTRDAMRAKMGFLDQEHRLPATLTVGEALLMAAVLRMPAHSGMAARQERVAQVLKALHMDHLLHSRIGDSHGGDTRGISGGEKRRVGVGMELMADPSVLLLDEPTSGLDSYNAEVLVDVLAEVARARGMAVLLSIHQPKYELFARLHRVLLLHHGRAVYWGPPEGPKAEAFLAERFAGMGRPLRGGGREGPALVGANPADLMIEALFVGVGNGKGGEGVKLKKELSFPELVVREESGQGIGDDDDDEEEEEEEAKAGDPIVAPAPAGQAAAAAAAAAEAPGVGGSKGKAAAAAVAGAPLWVQVSVLSQRMLRDHLRRPWLLACHVLANVYLGVLLGCMYLGAGRNVAGIAAIQDRMGLMMTIQLFLAFTSVSALPLFWLERPLYAYEVANGYYSPLAYFLAKALSDLIPLRVLPPLLLAGITTLLVGFRGGLYFFNYALALVLLTCIAATVNGTIGMLAHGIMSGILGATILMLHLLLLTSIFVNFKTMRWQWLGQLRYISFFQYGFDSLVSNEMAGRRLTDLPVESGTAVLAQLGFEPGRVDLNLTILFAYLAGALLLSYTVLARCVREKR